jgi:hypothetical protein
MHHPDEPGAPGHVGASDEGQYERVKAIQQGGRLDIEIGPVLNGFGCAQSLHSHLGSRYRYRLGVVGSSTSFERFPGVITSDYQRGSVYCICTSGHQTGYRGQCRD